jgi:bifunctional enzyme CysN/CysC
VASEPAELLRLATAGSVDDGKSTLIGRLLVDAKGVFEDQLEALSRSSVADDGAPDLAQITDGLRAEREQGITIDVAYRFFATPARSFIIADTPGHVRYTRNMVTGASTAEAALVLVDARNGIVEQSRRHTYLSSLLGIRHVIACVNKMDLVDWSEDRFREIESEFGALAAQLEIPDARVIPISALHGDNVVEPSERSPWYDGEPLLRQLETLEVASDRNFDMVRLPVQWVIRPQRGEHADYRGFAGQMAAGVLHPGDEVVVLPEGARTTVERIETLDGPLDAAFPPMSVTVLLADQLDAGRGSLISSPGDEPVVARRLEAMVAWMAEEPLRPGGRYLLKHASRTVRATVETLCSRVDVDHLGEVPRPGELALNDIGRVRLRTSAPVLADRYDRNRPTGAFILIDEVTRDTVGAGMIRSADEDEFEPDRSPNVTWHEPDLTREERWSALGVQGGTVWLTGLPASGKSTIAVELERRLVAQGRNAYLLDGDNVRHGISGDLGFSPADRAENARRVAGVARLFADAGVVSLVSLVSPYAEDRALARRMHEEAGLPFVEVFVDTPVEECERRDPKGLYARARAGDLPGFTGVDGDYEAPEDPELVIHPLEEAVDAAAERLLARLDEALGGAA